MSAAQAFGCEKSRAIEVQYRADRRHVEQRGQQYDPQARQPRECMIAQPEISPGAQCASR